MTDEPRTRVIVADDSVLLRDGLARLLEDAGFEVVARTGDGATLVEQVRADPPDLVVVDIRMPPSHTTEGLDAALTIRQTHPDVRILLLSQYVEPRNAIDLLRHRAGGVGYLLKDRVTDSASFTQAVATVARGGTVIDPEVVSQLFDRPREASMLDRLTDREREVLGLVAEGRSNRAIADELQVSLKTLEKHVSAVLQKLDLPSEPESHRRVLAVLTYLRAST